MQYPSRFGPIPDTGPAPPPVVPTTGQLPFMPGVTGFAEDVIPGGVSAVGSTNIQVMGVPFTLPDSDNDIVWNTYSV